MKAEQRAKSCGKAGPKSPLEIAGAIPTFPQLRQRRFHPPAAEEIQNQAPSVNL